MDMDWIKVKERDIEFEYRYAPAGESEFCDEQLYTIIVRTQFGLDEEDWDKRNHHYFDYETRSLIVKTLGNFSPDGDCDGTLEDDYFYIKSKPVYHRDWMK